MKSALDIGNVCIKTKGRKTGQKVVVVGFEKGFALIQGTFGKQKKCNVRHLFPTGKMIHVTKDEPGQKISQKLKEVEF